MNFILASESEATQEFINKTNGLTSFTFKEKLSCEGEITLQECELSLKSFKNNKTPGCDGLSSEFYQTF